MEEMQRHKAVCAECGGQCEVPFEPSQDRPVYCNDCFRKRRPRRNDGFRRGGNFNRNSGFRQQRQMHKAVCAECKQECEVPFRPKEGTPVYCNDCFKARKGNESEEDY